MHPLKEITVVLPTIDPRAAVEATQALIGGLSLEDDDFPTVLWVTPAHLDPEFMPVWELLQQRLPAGQLQLHHELGGSTPLAAQEYGSTLVTTPFVWHTTDRVRAGPEALVEMHNALLQWPAHAFPVVTPNYYVRRGDAFEGHFGTVYGRVYPQLPFYQTQHIRRKIGKIYDDTTFARSWGDCDLGLRLWYQGGVVSFASQAHVKVGKVHRLGGASDAGPVFDADANYFINRWGPIHYGWPHHDWRRINFDFPSRQVSGALFCCPAHGVFETEWEAKAYAR